MLMKNGLNTLKIRQNVKSIQWRKCGKKKGEMNEKNDIQIITGGLGLNFGVFYADLAYLHKASKLNGLFYYYETSKGQVIESPEFQTKFKDNEFRLTLGIRF